MSSFHRFFVCLPDQRALMAVQDPNFWSSSGATNTQFLAILCGYSVTLAFDMPEQMVGTSNESVLESWPFKSGLEFNSPGLKR